MDPVAANGTLIGPEDHVAFGEHFPLAVEAAAEHGHSLALVVLRADAAGRRGRERLHAALRRADGFAYEIQPGGYALLMPSTTARAALHEANVVRDGARGGLLRRGAHVQAGIAMHEPGLDAHALFARAADALAAAECSDEPACVHAGTHHLPVNATIS